MSAASASHSILMRRRLPWLDKREQNITSTAQSLSHTIGHIPTVDSDGAGSSSNLEPPDNLLNSSETPKFLEERGANPVAAVGYDVQPPTVSPSDARTPRDASNRTMVNLDEARRSPADKRDLLQMISDLLQGEPDMSSHIEPPPRNPRRLTGKRPILDAPSKTKIRPSSDSDRSDVSDSRRANILPAPAELGHMPIWSPENPLTLHPSHQYETPVLAELPPHLLPSSGSSSADDTAMHSPRVSSTSSDPNALHLRGPLNRAVTGLENLMEEALNTARDAAKTGRSEDVARVLNDATLALRKASMIRGMMREPSFSPSLASPKGSSRDRGYSDDSSSFDTRISFDTIPTIYTPGPRLSKPSFVTENAVESAQTATPQRVVFRDDSDDLTDSSTEGDSLASTPPQLYQSTSADSIVRDFAFPGKALRKQLRAHSLPQTTNDVVSPTAQSIVHDAGVGSSYISHTDGVPSIDSPLGQTRRKSKIPDRQGNVPPPEPLRHVEPVPIGPTDIVQDPEDPRPPHISPERSESLIDPYGPAVVPPPKIVGFRRRPSTVPEQDVQPLDAPKNTGKENGRRGSTIANDRRYDDDPSTQLTERDYSKDKRYSDPSLALKTEDLSLKNPRRKHLSLAKDQKFSLGRYHKRRPIAREWSTRRKRMTATITCLNTVFIGLIAGIYAGEVPRIQYQIADQNHLVLYGNVLLFAGLGISTFLFWPLPLLHGRKPYVSTAFALLLPLQFPQALAITSYRDPRDAIYRFGLLFPRVLTGLALGFANINFLPTLFDLYGASLMSKRPHQEIVVYDDVRRQGGGMGLWLGIWTFCFSSALAIGFCIGAGIIARLDPSWGFYVVVILLAFFLFVNVIAPETRRSPYRRSIAHFYDEDDPEKLKRRVARGEVKLHISNDGPKWWFEEVWAGVLLTTRMMRQPGFFVLMCYVGWIKAQLTLVILLLGALLSRDYRWRSEYVGLAALSVPIGAILALPLSKASCFSRSRSKPQRTDSMTFEPRLTWTSHLIQRILFSLLLPLAAVAYCLTAPGPRVHWIAPVVFAGLIGFLTDLGIAECIGLIMETFDTCDLQPGVNTRHRLVSMDPSAKRRRTNYSSFPRVCAGFFAADALGFLLSAVATGVSGRITRAYGAQTAIAIVAGVLLGTTICLLAVLWRWKEVQVVPNYTAGTTLHGTAMWTGPGVSDPSWKPVIVGNPSGKMRRMNLLEMGSWSRWTEIRKLNGLIRA